MVRLRAYLNQMLSFQLVDVASALLIGLHPLLKTAPNFVVNWILVGAVKWPEIGRCEFWCGLPGLEHLILDVHDEPARCTAERALVAMATAAAGTPLY